MLSEDLVDQAITVWEPRYGRKITREEAREILANLTGFFEILLDWNRSAQPGARSRDVRPVGPRTPRLDDRRTGRSAAQAHDHIDLLRASSRSSPRSTPKFAARL